VVNEVFSRKCLSAIAHAFDKVKNKAIVVHFIKVWFLFFIRGGILYLNGEVVLEGTNVDHLWVLGH
jgi:hypothetical protein